MSRPGAAQPGDRRSASSSEEQWRARRGQPAFGLPVGTGKCPTEFVRGFDTVQANTESRRHSPATCRCIYSDRNTLAGGFSMVADLIGKGEGGSKLRHQSQIDERILEPGILTSVEEVETGEHGRSRPNRCASNCTDERLVQQTESIDHLLLRAISASRWMIQKILEIISR